jgi:predicted acetyltransferase
MTRDAHKTSAIVEVIPAASEQEPILANLLQLYAHDFSEFHDIELGADGRFSYKQLPLYWSDSNRHPFLVRVDGKLAGLAFVKRGSEISGNQTVWDMAEFFVVRGYRRRGIGTEIAHQVWARFRGSWEVRVMHSNRHAREFWQRAISAFNRAPVHPVSVEKGGAHWDLFSFEA